MVNKIPNLVTRSVARNGFVDHFFFINEWHFCFTTIIVLNFKTFGYNGEFDGLWVHTVKLIFDAKSKNYPKILNYFTLSSL